MKKEKKIYADEDIIAIRFFFPLSHKKGGGDVANDMNSPVITLPLLFKKRFCHTLLLLRLEFCQNKISVFRSYTGV